MSKTKSNSKLGNLPDEQQLELAEALLSGMPYHEARKWIALPPPDGFGVSVSISAFTPFWDDFCKPVLLMRRQRAVGIAKSIGEECEKRPAQFEKATIDAIQAKALELAIAPTAKPKDVKSLFMLVLKAKDQALEERKIKLLEEKAAKADAAEKTLNDSELSAEERHARMKEIFGLR